MIRPVGPKEVATLRDISLATFLETFEADNRPEDVATYVRRAFTLERMREELGASESALHFIEVDGQVGGYLKLNWGEGQTESVLDKAVEIERIYVRSEFHGQSLGKQLLEFAISEARDHSADWLWLGVWEHNQKAIGFYERQGLEVFAEHTFMFGDTPQRDVLMRMKLS